MRYRNTKTGAEIEAACPISGGDWVPVSESDTGGNVSESDTAPKTKKTTRKKAEG